MYKIRLICNSFTVTIDTLKIGKSASIDDFIGCGLPMIRLISCFSFSKKYIDNYGFLIRFRCSPIPFIQWATSVTGVGKCVVLPLWNGNGTVKVLITDANGDPASTDLQKKVAAYIENVRPIGATVTVAAPTIFAVKVALKPLDSKSANATAIQNTINDYFGSHQFDNIRITCAMVGKMILENESCGVTDYESLTINGVSTMVTVTTDQIARCTEVTLNG